MKIRKNPVVDLLLSLFGSTWHPPDVKGYHLMWFRVLYRKNWLHAGKKWKVTAKKYTIACFLPFLLIFGSAYVFYMLPQESPFRDQHLVAEIQFPEPVHGMLLQKRKVLVHFLEEQLDNECGRDLYARIAGYPELFEIKTGDRKNLSTSIFDEEFVQFNNISVADGVPKLEYSVLARRLTTNRFPNFGPFFLTQRTVDDQDDHELFEEAQKFIDLTFAACAQKQMNNDTYYKIPEDATTQHRWTHYVAQPLYNYHVHSSMTTGVMFLAMYQILIMTEVIEVIGEERQSSFKSHLRTLGIGRFKYFFVHLVYGWQRMITTSLIIIVPWAYYMKAVSLFLLIVGLIPYTIGTTSFAILFANLFRWKSNFVIGLFLLWLFLHLETWNWNDPLFGYPRSLISSLNLPHAWFMFVMNLAQHRMLGRSEMIPPMFAGAGNYMTAGVALILLFVDAALIFLLAIYIDAIRGDYNEESLHPLFMFMPSFWRKKTAELPVGFVRSSTTTANTQTQSKQSKAPPGNVTLTDVSLSKNDVWMLEHVHLMAQQGELTVLYGHRECGRAILLDVIEGIRTPEWGEIIVDGQKSKGIMPSTVAVCGNLIPFIEKLSLRDHMEMFSNLRNGWTMDTEEELRIIATNLQIQERMDEPVGQLTVSEKRRAAVLLAFVGDCPVVTIRSVSDNCDLTTKRLIESQLHKLKAHRTIIITSNNPVETEMLGDQVVLMNRGSVLSNGSLEELKETFGSAFLLSVWPESSFNQDKARDLARLILKSVGAVDVDNFFNQNIRFRFPPRKQSEYNEILKELQDKSGQLGIKYFEMQKTGVEELYGQAIDIDEEALKVQKDPETPKKIQQLYDRPKRAGCSLFLAQMLSVWMSRLRFTRSNCITYLSSFAIPLFICGIIMIAVSQSKPFPDSLCLDTLKNVNVVVDPIMEPYVQKAIVPNSGINVVVKDTKEIHQRTNSWFYEFPVNVLGIYRNDTKDSLSWIFTYSLSTLQKGKLRASNLLANVILGRPDAVKVCLQDGENREYRPEMNISTGDSRLLKGFRKDHATSAIVNAQSYMIICAVTLAVVSAQFTLFPSFDFLSRSVKMKNHYGMGRFTYWTANVIYDLIGYIIYCSLIVAVICGAANDEIVFSLAVAAFLLYFFAIISFAYLVAYFTRSPVISYIAMFVYTLGPPLLIKVQLMNSERSARNINYIVDQTLYYASYVSPSIGASTIIGMSVELHDEDYKDLDKFTMVSHSFATMATHLWAWLVLIIISSTFVRRQFAKVKLGLASSEKIKDKPTMWNEDLISNSYAEENIEKTVEDNYDDVDIKEDVHLEMNDDDELSKTKGNLISRKASSLFPKGGTKSQKVSQMTTGGTNKSKMPTVTKSGKTTVNETEESRVDAGKDEEPHLKKESNENLTTTRTQMGGNSKSNQNTSRTRVSCQLRTVRTSKMTSENEISALIFASMRTPQTLSEGNASMLTVHNLAVSRNGFVVLKDIQFTIGDTMLAVYGWEGTGGSELVRTIAGLIHPGQGAVKVISTDPKAKPKVNFVPSYALPNGLLDYLTGYEMLYQTCMIKGYYSKDAKELIQILSKCMGLQEILNRKIKTYLIPDRTLLLLAMACTDQPTVLALDDPAGCGCPRALHVIWSFMMMMRSWRTSVIFSTSSPLETEYLADHVMFLANGRSIAPKTVTGMKNGSTRRMHLVMTMKPGVTNQLIPAVTRHALESLKPEEMLHGNPKQVAMCLYVKKGQPIDEVFKDVHGLLLNLPVAEYSLTMSSFDDIYNGQ